MLKNVLYSIALLLSTILISTNLKAESSATLTKAKSTIDADVPRLTEMFKGIHKDPELGFMEVKTSSIVAQELKDLGFEVKTGIGKTGVVGILKNGKGPTVMYRADMDANAVEEKTGLPYASKKRVVRDDGIEVPAGHMCGHDAHTVWMLGMAKALVSVKDQWSGTIILVGQPAEEVGEGAQAMIDDGFYTKYGIPKPDFFIGMHTAPIPIGMVANMPGVRMAGTVQLDVTFHGIGGHGSSPHLAKDPIVMAAMAIIEYQVIISRIVDPLETAVLTVGSVQAGTDNNVIPETALLKLNLRYFNPKVKEQMIAAIKRINEGIANTYNVGKDKMPTIVIKGTSEPLVNDTVLVERLNTPLKSLLSEKGVLNDIPPALASEDIHLLMAGNKDIPFAFVLVGIADPAVFAKAQKQGKPFPYAPHNPNYIVDLQAIPMGTKIATGMMLELLDKK
ncbi:MAG: amidohydrolase [Desulfovibrionaceae bacterium]